ncbi:UNVERIFIED_CONTAM: hypothetical protein Sradi_2024200 [Sesamum radiatum]|uniref:Uncharacterized protein n=1 Tax=Sesamum radiatum TaxID=300843 RepID=A0AAW2THA3_SESRA
MFDGVTVWAGNNVAICSHTAVVTICCMVYRSPGGSSPEEVLWCGDSVRGSAGLGGPGTIAPLEGAALLARDRDVLSTIYKAWALSGASTTFCFLKGTS